MLGFLVGLQVLWVVLVGLNTAKGQQFKECAALPGLRRNRVVGGNEASPNHWSSVGSLQTISSTYICGGSIITPNWVVTAAHCLDSIHDDADDYQVVFGDHNQDPSSGREVIARVSRIIKHEHYGSDGPGFRNDIALLKLSQPVQFTRYIQPACLPTVNNVFTSSDECLILGWGETKGTRESNVLLRELRLDIIPNTNCSAMWSKYPHPGARVLPFHICVGVVGSETCNGDSDGHVFCKKGDQWVTVGVSSWAVGDCDTPEFPAVYSRITSYLSWIRHIIQQDTTTTPGAAFG